MSSRDDIIAVLFFDGVGDVGAFIGDTRNITGYTVTNNAIHNGVAVPIRIRVEEELNKQRTFTVVVQPGQTIEDLNITPPSARPVQVWAKAGPFFWDGINVYIQVPA